MERLHPTLAFMPDGSGGFCRYEFFACGAWVTPAVPGAPKPPLDKWLLAQVSQTAIPEIMRFNGTRFSSPNGAIKSVVWRWAEIVLVESVTETQPGPVPPLHAPALGQALVDQLLKNYKRADILNWLDLSPYNNPNEGAPEP